MGEPGKDLSAIPAEKWGTYSEAQNAAVEEAFRSGRPSVKTCIGIREYEIIFDGPSSAQQVDHKLKKRRLVRRRLVTPDERERSCRALCNSEETGDLACSICVSTFAETPTVPRVKLPECGHIFHCVCIQHVADKRGQCPLCRSEVDWLAAFGSA